MIDGREETEPDVLLIKGEITGHDDSTDLSSRSLRELSLSLRARDLAP